MLEALAWTLIISGILGILVDLIAVKAVGEKLSAKDFALKVTLPTTLSLSLMFIGFLTLLSDVKFEGADYVLPFQIVIVVTSVFGIAMSFLSAMLSMIRLRWVGD